MFRCGPANLAGLRALAWAMDDVAILPFFPLGLIAYPGEEVSLHIFEPRYRQLFGELRSGEVGSFVIVPHVGDSLRSRATELELADVSREYASGELDVRARGVGVVEITGFRAELEGKLYAGGEVQRLDFDLDSGGSAEAFELRALCGDLMRALGVHRDLPDPALPSFSFGVGHRVGLTTEQEFGLLTLPTEADRLRYLLGLVREAIATAERTSDIKRRVQANGHFRYIRSSEDGGLELGAE